MVSSGLANDWPHGRGCFISKNKEFIIWVGEEDNLKFIGMHKGTDMNKVWAKLERAIDTVERLVGGYKKDKEFG